LQYINKTLPIMNVAEIIQTEENLLMSCDY
jgi:hypothetical protein